MKVISIKFMNLNSLKGEHEIRFDKAPFSESGIFAITGPTGAGKTTLLDAITAALYGRVHRHSKDVFEIMTRHTAESYAEVEFEVGLQIYRAKWSVRRSRGKADGQLQTPKMELADVSTGKIIIEHPLQEVREEIVRLCGLDYNQFLRSVILSQGDFTRFLKADENERSELLEKITDTGIYSQISIAAYDKAREEKIKLDQMRGRLEHVVLLNPVEREIYSLELKELEGQEEQLRLQEKDYRNKIDWLTGLEKLESRKRELLSALSEAELFHAQYEHRFAQLQRHLRALVHRPALAELHAIENQQKRIGLELEMARLQQPALQQAEELTRTALGAAKEKAALQEKVLTDLEPVLVEVGKKDMLITQAQNAVDRISKDGNLMKTALLSISAQQTQLSEKQQFTGQRIATLDSWLKEHAGDELLNKDITVFEQQVQQLRVLKQRIVAAEGALAEQDKMQQEATVSLSAGKATIALTEQKIAEVENSIRTSAAALEVLLAGKTTEQLEAELRVLPVLIHTSEQQLRTAALYHTQLAEEKELVVAQAAAQSRHYENQEALARLQDELATATALLADLQQIYELEVRVSNYEDARLLLEPEKPCPLCGALHHPFAESDYQGRLGETAIRRNQQQEKLQLLKSTLDQQLLQSNTLKHQLETGEKGLLRLRENLAALLAEFELGNSKLPAALAIHQPEIIRLVIGRKKQQQQALEQQLDVARTLALQLMQAEALAVKHKEQLAVNRSVCEQLVLSIAFAGQQLNAVHADFLAAREESTVLQHKAKVLLSSFDLVFDLQQAEALLGRLNVRYQQFLHNVKEHQRLQPELRQLETELKNIVSSLQEKQGAMETLNTELNIQQQIFTQLQADRLALFGNKDPLTERKAATSSVAQHRKNVEDLQLQLQGRQSDLRVVDDRQVNLNTSFLTTKKLFQEHLERLTESINSEGLDSVDELKKLFLPDDEAREAEALQQESSRKLNTAKSLLSATEKDLQVELLKTITDVPKSALTEKLEEYLQAISLLQQQKGRVKKVLADDDQLKQKHAEVAAQVSLQQQEFDRFQKLSLLIGSADGKKFSRFAQGLTLARLTQLANRHLLRLSDRYTILKSPEKDLDLQIIDGYQADVVRPMSTLSGGESFLVSLALALGLSDLASRKVQINSLFIDEGFGTLDAETLDVAITALENLQASGKNIGIISHVEALKERIGTQIQLSRLPGGTSKISLSSYGNRIA